MDGHRQPYIELARAPPCRHPASSSWTTDTAPLLSEACAPDMCPALYRAVRRGRTGDTMALLQQQHGVASDHQATGITQHGRCDIQELSAERNTVLHVAAEQGHSELIQELVLRFGDKARGLLPRRNSALDTPLHCAARAGSGSAVRTLVRLVRNRGEVAAVLRCKNEAGDTALHLAARHGHDEAVEALVTAEPTVAAERNNAGVSPLYLAVMSGSERALRAIVEHCSDDASCAGPNSQNALHAAVLQRKGSKMVEILLNWRPALAAQVDSSGSSPLHSASSDGDLSIVRAILRGAPSRTAYQKDAAGLSALHIAALMGHDRVVKELLERCPDAAQLRDGGGGTFLHAAAREKRISVVSLAFKKKRCCTRPLLHGLLNAQDKEGNTPLHLAVAAGAPGIVEALLRKGGVAADVLNNDGNTALDLVAESTNYFIMASLVVTLVAFKAQPRPQRQDHLKPWSSTGIAKGIEKTSDSLTVVAVLIATAALAAGFNLPGGYSDSGTSNLMDKHAFKWFLSLDTVAAAASVVAAILLVYGKASSSAGSWKSFVASLHLIWVSLVSLMLAFYAALVAVASTRSKVYDTVYLVLQVGIQMLILWISTWIVPETKSATDWRYLWQSCRAKGRHVIKRQYPLARASMLNFLFFVFTNFAATTCFIILYRQQENAISPAPSPISL